MNSGVSWTLGRLRRVQRAGPDGEPVVPGEAQVRDRRRQPPVLPLQLEVPRHEPQEDRPRPPMSGGGGGSNARIERERHSIRGGQTQIPFELSIINGQGTIIHMTRVVSWRTGLFLRASLSLPPLCLV